MIALVALALALIWAAPAGAADHADPRGHLHGVYTRTGAPRAALTTPFSAGNLLWQGGPVMHSNTTHAIYWDPSGELSSTYHSAVESFLTNVGADSGRDTNVYSVATQYWDSSGHVAYNSGFAAGMVDGHAFPSNGCSPHMRRPVCLTDAQIKAELARLGLTGGLGDVYIVLTPPSVETCFDAAGSQCSSNYYCAYHDVTAKNVVYANIPYPSGGCDEGQSPNGDSTVDQALNSISHEHMEMITDPELNAWMDASGSEIGDKCGRSFGTPLGGSPGSEYNQSIGSGHYWLQQEWSNASGGCATSMHIPPSPALNLSTLSATAGEAISFDASGSTASGVPLVSYSFDFGDGTAANGPTQSHAYTAAGVYTVTLTVTDAAGASSSTKRTIAVATPPDHPPICYSGAVVVSANLTARLSLPCDDPDGDLLDRYVVTLPRHGTVDSLDQRTGTIEYTPYEDYRGVDSFTIAAVDRRGGRSAPATVTITVGNRPASAASDVVTIGAIKLAHPPGRTRLRYRVARAGKTTFWIERVIPGARRGSRCVRTSARVARSAQCVLHARLGASVTITSRAGMNVVALSRILGHVKLVPGSYRVVAVFHGRGRLAGSIARVFRVTR